jgi:hypothetical protein
VSSGALMNPSAVSTVGDGRRRGPGGRGLTSLLSGWNVGDRRGRLGVLEQRRRRQRTHQVAHRTCNSVYRPYT